MTQCPCFALIGGDLAPKTFEKDVTLKVIQLATTGDLRTIQLTNRYFPALPDELRRCSKMRHLSLVYAHTETLPIWTKEYTHLEYLYIEGAFDSSLLELPPDMLDEMSSLTFIHLEMHLRLQTLPSCTDM
ncbi:Leucine-rich repeat domain, L domain-like [Phytophthora cactorum]|nr:Leucine-rich repeat domain, L domain-like [Phytophthora cactorum]